MRTHQTEHRAPRGVTVVADVHVTRLHLSPLGHLLRVLRWTLGLAVAVVVLWFGGALLLATPASAATAAAISTTTLAKHVSQKSGKGGSPDGESSGGESSDGESSDGESSDGESSGDSSGSSSEKDENSDKKDDDKKSEKKKEKKDEKKDDESSSRRTQDRDDEDRSSRRVADREDESGDKKKKDDESSSRRTQDRDDEDRSSRRVADREDESGDKKKRVERDTSQRDASGDPRDTGEESPETSEDDDQDADRTRTVGPEDDDASSNGEATEQAAESAAPRDENDDESVERREARTELRDKIRKRIADAAEDYRSDAEASVERVREALGRVIAEPARRDRESAEEDREAIGEEERAGAAESRAAARERAREAREGREPWLGFGVVRDRRDDAGDRDDEDRDRRIAGAPDQMTGSGADADEDGSEEAASTGKRAREAREGREPWLGFGVVRDRDDADERDDHDRWIAGAIEEMRGSIADGIDRESSETTADERDVETARAEIERTMREKLHELQERITEGAPLRREQAGEEQSDRVRDERRAARQDRRIERFGDWVRESVTRAVAEAAAAEREQSEPEERDERRARVVERAEAIRDAMLRGGDGAGAVDGLVDEIREAVSEGVRSSGSVGELTERVLRSAVEAVGRADDRLLGDGENPTTDDGRWSGEMQPPRCTTGGAGCDDGSLDSLMSFERNSRAPPRSSESLEHLFTQDEESSSRSEDDDEDDSEDRVERALNSRIAADRGQRSLAQEQGQVAAGQVTQDVHNQHALEQQQRAQQAEADWAELSDEEAELIDEVIEGHRALDERRATLEAEEQQVAAGTVDAASHQRNVAQYDEDEERLYEATDELREAMGYDNSDAVPDSASDNGSAAGCISNGALVECGSVSESDAGEERDRCIALEGVSSGCSVATSSGETNGSASCVLNGPDTGCGSNTSSGENTATAWCARGAGNCAQTSSADTEGAEAACESASECRSSTSSPRRIDKAASPGAANETIATLASCTGECELEGVSSADGADARCYSAAGGNCDTSSSGAVSGSQGGMQASGAARCQGAGRTGCGATSSVELGDGESSVVEADAGVECDGPGCSGTGTASTSGSMGGAQAAASQQSSGNSSFEVTGGAGTASSSTGADGPVDVPEQTDGEARSLRNDEFATAGFAMTAPARDAGARSSTEASVDCPDASACNGKAATATTGKITGSAPGAVAPVRETGASAACETTSGPCGSQSSSEVSDTAAPTPPGMWRWRSATDQPARPAGRELAASSQAGAQTFCAVDNCRGTGTSTTSGSASGDISGVSDSTASSICSIHGSGSDCVIGTETTVADRAPTSRRGVDRMASQVATGPVSVSTANAEVGCTGDAGECGGSATTATSALDTAVSPHRRGTESAVSGTVDGGEWRGQSTSSASSAPDFVVTDPATGRPVAGQPTSGPSSVASASAMLDCPEGCTGTASSSASGVDGAVLEGRVQGSSGTVACAGAGAPCTGQTNSAASSAPGAAELLAGQGQRDADAEQLARYAETDGAPTPAAANVPVGPSSVSDASASLDCPDGCTGSASSYATGTDGISVRGSNGTAGCKLPSGSACRGSTRSVSSSGSNVATLLPDPTDTGETDREATDDERRAPGSPLAPGTGDGMNAGTVPAPVPGPSSVSDASAVVDCPSDCVGGAYSRTSGSDAPGAAGMTGGAGARGPPSTSETTTTGTCDTGESVCQVGSSRVDLQACKLEYSIVSPK